MSPAAVVVPEAVRRKARALGWPGERWLEDLPGVIAVLEHEWEIVVGGALGGGSGSYVAEAVTADGVDAVLKLAIPAGLEGQHTFARELSALTIADGGTYVRVLRADTDRRAMLQERLGRTLTELALPVSSQIEIIARTLRPNWSRPDDASALKTGAEQARSLAEDIAARWESLHRPVPRATIEQAIRYAADRHHAFHAASAVFVHGDAHPANVLEAARGAGPRGGFKLVDPDAMLSEPAHDLAIPLRDWSDELLARDAVALGLEWCAHLGRLAGVDSLAIWQWAFVERVSTGLYTKWLGDPHGDRLLEVASLWTGAEPALRSAG